MNRVIYVPAQFSAVGKYRNVKVPTGETRRNILGNKVPETRTEQEWQITGYSDKEVDGVRLAKDMDTAVARLSSEGYRVVSVTPVTSGNYDHDNFGGIGRDGGYGYGYSYTEGIIIVAERIK